MNKQSAHCKHHTLTVATVILALTACGTASAVVPWPNLPSTPIAIQAQADPNIVFTLDDSGSMAWAYVPDNLYGSIGTTSRFLSWRVNPLAYNPFTVYEQPYTSALDGSKRATSFTTAWINGYNTSAGSINLSTNYKPVYSYNPSGSSQSFTTSTAAAAYIYAFYNDVGPGNTLPTPGDDPDSFTRNTVKPGGCGGLTDVNNDSCYVKIVIPAAHQQNFANWYSFYKTRNLLTTTSANLAFYDLNPNYRITWQALNTCSGGFNTTCQGWNGTNYPNWFRPLSNFSNKQTFYNWLSRLPANSGTPLRTAVQRAGEFFKDTGINSTRANDPGTSEAPISTCRANFHVVMTDGIWNTDSLSIGNQDGSAKTFPDGTSYNPVAPFTDTNSNNIADLAFKYWSTDLQPTVANEIIPYYVSGSTDYWDAKNDPATWQHVVTFTVGLGLGKWLTATNRPEWGGSMYAGDYPNLKNGSVQWPATSADSTGNVADLWHAAINSRGMFFSADSPQSIQSAFAQILNRIKANATSLGQVASSTSRITAGTVAVDLKFVPGDWYTTLTAYSVFADGSRGAPIWNTDLTLTSDSGRNIFTSVNGNGTSFDSSFFSSYGASLLGTTDSKLFAWLRGQRSYEGSTSGSITLRKRKQLLGDVVGSDLVISGKTDQGFQFLPDAGGDASAARNSYSAYVQSKRSVVFVGANDGMVHAFQAADGTELFAFVPNAVLGRLRRLADSNYVHEYFVDGSLALYDAYLNGSWKTILVGGLGGGGRGWFGLDVTNAITGGGFAASDVLFDLSLNKSDPNLKELGYSLPIPVISRTFAGEWVALLPNGYGDNSVSPVDASTNSCRAILMVYNLSTRSITKLDTGAGSCAVGNYNGLSSVSGLEFAVGAMVGAYAGDYQGNIWKFMLDTSNGTWKLPVLFYQARDSGNKKQPVTSQILLKKHPAGGVMVLFGTGKFFEASDRSDKSVHTFYGLRDTGASISAGRSSLVQQSITTGTAIDISDTRTVSNLAVDWTTMRGWYVDFNSTLFGAPSGERIVASPIMADDVVLFSTYAPGANACTGAGAGFLMALNTFKGSGTLVPLFDRNNDGKIDSLDMVAGASPSGLKVSGGGLKGISTTVVTTSSRGFQTGGGPAPTCGGTGMAPCATGDPCADGLTVKNNVCVPLLCRVGNIQVSAGGLPICMSAESSKYPRWMELN